MYGQDGGDAVGLDRSWSPVLAQLDVVEHDRVKTSILELERLVEASTNTHKSMFV